MAGQEIAGRQVVCIKWGKLYPPHYVNRLYGMVSRHLDPPFRFTCFTERPKGIRPEVDVQPLPDLGAKVPASPGQWGKSRLWSERLADLHGPFLFIDLDCVILADLAPFFEHGDPREVILARNPNTPFERLGQTSVYRAPVGKLAPLRERFLSDPLGTQAEYRFEQRFVTRLAPGGVRFWPKGWVVHYRQHCRSPFPLNYVRDPKPPKGARIVIFAGSMNPPDAIAGQRFPGMPVAGPSDHLRATFDGRRQEGLLRHLRGYTRPAQWIEEAWRE